MVLQIFSEDEELVNVDGTKVKLSGKLLKRAEDVKRKSLILKVPKDAVSTRKRRRAAGTVTHCDYLSRHHGKTANRRRTDPVVTLSTILEEILNEMRESADVQPFLFPVPSKSVPDYYKIVQRPMDLQTIRDNLRQKKYQSREEFLSDVNQVKPRPRRPAATRLLTVSTVLAADPGELYALQRRKVDADGVGA